MKILLLFLIIGIIGVEFSIYFIIPSELTGNGNKSENLAIFFGIVPAYFILWYWCVTKKTYAKESPDAQWSKISIVIFAIIFQIIWFFILSYFRNRVSFALAGICASISLILPILRIYEIGNPNVKVVFLIMSAIVLGIILWVSIEFIIYEKFITYGWIVAYYVYPIYLGLFAGLFVNYLRIEEIGVENQI
jgi:hypothetical protein